MSITKTISLDDGIKPDSLKPVKISFSEPVTWTYLTVEELLKILELWIVGEELKYPQEKGFKGRWLLFDEIKRVFNTTEVYKDETGRNTTNKTTV